MTNHSIIAPIVIDQKKKSKQKLNKSLKSSCFSEYGERNKRRAHKVIYDKGKTVEVDDLSIEINDLYHAGKRDKLAHITERDRQDGGQNRHGQAQMLGDSKEH